MAARRPPSTPRARSGARGAAPRAGLRAVDCRPGRRVGSDEKRLSARSSASTRSNRHRRWRPAKGRRTTLPGVLVPAEPERPDTAYERAEVRDRVRARDRSAAVARAEGDRPLLLRRSHDEADRAGDRRQRVARVAAPRARDSPPARRARQRDAQASRAAEARRRNAEAPVRPCCSSHAGSRAAAKAHRSPEATAARRRTRPVVVTASTRESRAARSKSPSLNGLASQRQPLSSRKRSASVPATSPVTKITRRANVGVAAQSRDRTTSRPVAASSDRRPRDRRSAR